ncbi:dynamin family protein [Aeromonas allosaccharophila]
MLREELLTSFCQLQGQFASSLEGAKKQDELFQQAYGNFQKKMTKHLKDTEAKLPQSNPLSSQIKHFIQSLTAQDQSWRDRLSERDKGLAFQKGFEDSLLVFVFGKVKSGKSSLGNYMAWGDTDPTDEMKNCQFTNKPEYLSHENTKAGNGDAHREAENKQEFRVGAIEATSSIQSFSLPGLTWVDSPGLHSVKEENGKLAEKYVQYADLILYTMSSGSPGRASDMNEIRELLSKNKEVLLLLTGSDNFIETDWDEEKDCSIGSWAMKTEQVRKAQRDHVAKELEENGISRHNLGIISISARYAQINANDTTLMADSGMVELFLKLNDISLKDGVRMKRNVPLNNFLSFLSECQKDLEPYSQQISKFSTDFDKLHRTLSQAIIRQTRQAQASMRDVIDASFSQLVDYRDNESAMNSAMHKAQSGWAQAHQQIVEQAIADIFSDITSEFKSVVGQTWQSSCLELPNFSVDKVTEEIPDVVIKGNRKRNGGIASILGGIAGLFVAGPVGAAAGATLAGGAASMMSDGAQVRTRTIEMAVGDNLNVIQAKAVENYSQSITSVIQDHANKLTAQLLKDTQMLTSALGSEVNTLSDEIEKLKNVTTCLLNQR